jgi:hypothetical protein
MRNVGAWAQAVDAARDINRTVTANFILLLLPKFISGKESRVEVFSFKGGATTPRRQLRIYPSAAISVNGFDFFVQLDRLA